MLRSVLLSAAAVAAVSGAAPLRPDSEPDSAEACAWHASEPGAPSGTASPKCAAARQSESVLLQSRAALTLDRFGERAKPEEAAWSAGPFGGCIRCVGDAPKRRRQVECRSVFGTEALPPSRCAAAGAPPAAQEPCSCEEAPCADGPCEAGAPAAKSVGEADGPRGVATPYRAIGCLPLAAGGAKESGASSDGVAQSGSQDAACIGWKGEAACNGGLPFYRMHSNAMSPSLCFSFCTSKSLDLFGITSAGDCRCGASSLNTAVWKQKAPPAGLSVPTWQLQPETSDGACPLQVFRYVGHFQDGGVPFELTDATVGDEAYIDSVVAGHTIDAEAEEDTEAVEDRRLLAAKAKPADGGVEGSYIWGQPAWNRRCWPKDCGPGGGAWKKRRGTLIAGIQGRWQEYAVIEFFFLPEVDDVRRAAFRKAVDAWREATCIQFVEAASTPPAPSIIVSNYEVEKDHCFSTHIGYPGSTEYVTVNLGWCSDERYIGNIIHELGHAIGMNHEQKRPDAVKEYYGHGPHLKVHWENVGHWADQYEADPESYVGSADDGRDDPHVGYAEYDFGSIMHYPTGNHFETIPAEKGVLTGNRHTLTEGDIAQVLDMYQCKRN